MGRGACVSGRQLGGYISAFVLTMISGLDLGKQNSKHMFKSSKLGSALDPDCRAGQTPVTFNQALLLDQSLKTRENSKNNVM